MGLKLSLTIFVKKQLETKTDSQAFCTAKEKT